MVDFPDVFRPTVSSVCLFSIISEIYVISTLIFTDVSKSDDGTGFGLYVPNVWQVGCCLHEPLSVFTAVISTLLDALLFIKSSQPGEYLILSASLNSIGALISQKISAKKHSIIYKCKEVLWWLHSRQYGIHQIPAQVGIPGNVMVVGITGVRILPAD
jgi:hypothetical protein